jgi:hypothetical protein
MPAARHSGVIAAYLAEKGFTGSPGVNRLLAASRAPCMGSRAGDDPGRPGTLGNRARRLDYAACASAHTIDSSVTSRSWSHVTSTTAIHGQKGHVNIGWPYQPAEIITLVNITIPQR